MDKFFNDVVLTQGIFAILFCWLLFYSKKEDKERELKAQEREDKLQSIIFNNQKIMQEMAEKLKTVEEVKEDVKEIINKLDGATN
ncbi:BhlA/UviB family holin-like peptide [Romboutsia sp. 1001713B170131_170501_G6]|uniref:BhlA/UviB family holin-like peptide n=1 Tax=Romboutsia sp. 1001713B170131_170501_G6 TaxID=2787108 RepID=UPI0018A9F243|nr:BhlA/UviB family holin-like peptide [Romboutsia sp. 1001713B170131_170501_G6]